MGGTCVKLYMIIVSYVYKKPIIIIGNRSGHKFQMCKEDDHKSQIWLHMTTWLVYKIGFYKIRESKTCHFWKIMQITPYSISNNYKLSMVAFNNIF
jgi:hypothetical protein